MARRQVNDSICIALLFGLVLIYVIFISDSCISKSNQLIYRYYLILLLSEFHPYISKICHGEIHVCMHAQMDRQARHIMTPAQPAGLAGGIKSNKIK